MTTEILATSKGPVVLHNGALLYLTDQEAICGAIDDCPNLLPLLEETTIMFFKQVSEYVVEALLAKRVPDIKIMNEAVSALDRFHILAYSVYRGYLDEKILLNNPKMSRDEVLYHVVQSNPDIVNNFYQYQKR